MSQDNKRDWLAIWGFIVAAIGSIAGGVGGCAAYQGIQLVTEEKKSTEQETNLRMLLSKVLVKKADGLTVSELRNAIEDRIKADGGVRPELPELNDSNIENELLRWADVGAVVYDFDSEKWISGVNGINNASLYVSIRRQQFHNPLIELVAKNYLKYNFETLMSAYNDANKEKRIDEPDYNSVITELCKTQTIRVSTKGLFYTAAQMSPDIFTLGVSPNPNATDNTTKTEPAASAKPDDPAAKPTEPATDVKPDDPATTQPTDTATPK